MKTRTLIVSDDKVKALFKKETYKNGKEMSEVTEAFWKQYIVASVQARKERYEGYKKDGLTYQNGEDERQL